MHALSSTILEIALYEHFLNYSLHYSLNGLVKPLIHRILFSIVNSIPPLLSPLLGNSPCTSSLIPRYKRGWRTSAPSWTVNLANQVTRTSVSPLVDRNQA